MNVDLELCIYSRDLELLIEKLINNTRKDMIKHLEKNPIYKCYFCDGFNYNCESYKYKVY